MSVTSAGFVARALLQRGTISQTLSVLREGTTSAVALVDASAELMRERASCNAFVSASYDLALSEARRSDERRTLGTAFPLDGIPLAVKDNFCTLGVKTTAASVALGNYTPPFESTVTKRLREAGVVVVGKTNMDEFGMGSNTSFSAAGPTLNPLQETRSPGGSSGGSSAAVASGAALGAIGSDTGAKTGEASSADGSAGTDMRKRRPACRFGSPVAAAGGSVRLPAAYCGLVGFKPSYGRVSRWGLIAFTSSLDTPGFLTRSVEDAELLYLATLGEDPRDPTTLGGTALVEAEDEPPAPLRVGIPAEYGVDELSPGSGKAWAEAAAALRASGCTVEAVSLPSTRAALAAYYILAPSEAASNLARYRGLAAQSLSGEPGRENGPAFGAEVTRRVLLGTFATSSDATAAYYERAQRVRRVVASEFAAAFRGVDVLLTPSAPTTAPELGRAGQSSPAAAYAADVMTIPASLAGLPAIALPFGSESSGMPTSVQLIAARGRERTLLRAARVLEALAATNARS